MRSIANLRRYVKKGREVLSARNYGIISHKKQGGTKGNTHLKYVKSNGTQEGESVTNQVVIVVMHVGVSRVQGKLAGYYSLGLSAGGLSAPGAQQRNHVRKRSSVGSIGSNRAPQITQSNFVLGRKVCVYIATLITHSFHSPSQLTLLFKLSYTFLRDYTCPSSLTGTFLVPKFTLACKARLDL